MPAKQQSTLCCLALLALAKLKKDTPCNQATNDWRRIPCGIALNFYK
ncbi:MAG: hypothetical protein SPF56_07535 [Bacteroidaceae bacterium]|nr:hypothetical protein [Bacteroidaceae bacterium]